MSLGSDVERRILDAYKRDGIDLSNANRDALRRTTRATAYHEAGHVAAGMFTGMRGSEVFFVSIIPEGHASGRARWSGIAEIEVLAGRGQDGLPQRLVGRCLLLHWLAGRGAVARIAAPDEREEILTEDALALQEEEDEDLVQAQKIARAIARPRMPAWRVLPLVAKWTEEMLALPGVWNAVEQLATKLLEGGTIESLYEIMETCCEIRGLSFRLPKWKQRLLPTKAELELIRHTTEGLKGPPL
jgi:hypothetical protein